jgi:hypothetical protein
MWTFGSGGPRLQNAAGEAAAPTREQGLLDELALPTGSGRETAGDERKRREQEVSLLRKCHQALDGQLRHVGLRADENVLATSFVSPNLYWLSHVAEADIERPADFQPAAAAGTWQWQLRRVKDGGRRVAGAGAQRVPARLGIGEPARERFIQELPKH